MVPATAIRAAAARTRCRARCRCEGGARRGTSPSCRVAVVQVHHAGPQHGSEHEAAADRPGRAAARDGEEEVLADLPVRFPVGGLAGHVSTVRLAAHSATSRPSPPDGPDVYAVAGHPFCLIWRPRWAPPIPRDT